MGESDDVIFNTIEQREQFGGCTSTSELELLRTEGFCCLLMCLMLPLSTLGLAQYIVVTSMFIGSTTISKFLLSFTASLSQSCLGLGGNFLITNTCICACFPTDTTHIFRCYCDVISNGIILAVKCIRRLFFYRTLEIFGQVLESSVFTVISFFSLQTVSESESKSKVNKGFKNVLL